VSYHFLYVVFNEVNCCIFRVLLPWTFIVSHMPRKPFYSLLNALRDLFFADFRVDFLQRCVDGDVIPRQLYWKNCPKLDYNDSVLSAEWNRINFDHALRLLHLALDCSRKRQRSCAVQVEDVTNSIIDSVGYPEYLRLHRDVLRTLRSLRRHLSDKVTYNIFHKTIQSPQTVPTVPVPARNSSTRGNSYTVDFFDWTVPDTVRETVPDAVPAVPVPLRTNSTQIVVDTVAFSTLDVPDTSDVSTVLQPVSGESVIKSFVPELRSGSTDVNVSAVVRTVSGDNIFDSLVPVRHSTAVFTDVNVISPSFDTFNSGYGGVSDSMFIDSFNPEHHSTPVSTDVNAISPSFGNSNTAYGSVFDSNVIDSFAPDHLSISDSTDITVIPPSFDNSISGNSSGLFDDLTSIPVFNTNTLLFSDLQVISMDTDVSFAPSAVLARPSHNVSVSRDLPHISSPIPTTSSDPLVGLFSPSQCFSARGPLATHDVSGFSSISDLNSVYGFRTCFRYPCSFYPRGCFGLQ